MATTNAAFKVKNDLVVQGTGTSTMAGSLTITGALIAASLSLTTALPVTSGGTGILTGTTAYGLLAAGTTATGAFQTLAAGATTDILVGGGAAALPAWTTATGTGAPVRAGSPTFTGTVGVAAITATGLITTVASAVGSAGLRLPHGAAPTSPVDGDVWTTSAGGMYARINGVTIGPFGASGAAANISGGATNQIVYQTAASTTGFITTANNGVLVTSGAGAPSISTALPSNLTIPNFRVSVSATVSAAGSTQGTATALSSDLNVTTTVASNTGVVLPTAVAGMVVVVVNKGANPLNLYPASGGQIDALGSNIALVIPVGGWVEVNASSTTQWYSTNNAPVAAALVTGTLAVTQGGTGRATSTTAYGLLAAGTTATGAHQTLAAGATTDILVGGGASALPAWTTSTGTGAPARAGSPTFTGTVGFAALSGTGNIATSAGTVADSLGNVRAMPLTLTNAAKTFVLTEANQAFGKDTTTARTYTIPANSSVAFPVGTMITMYNNFASGNITVAITTDTLILAGPGTTGSRTLAPWGVCTALKIASTTWIISGTGLT